MAHKWIDAQRGGTVRARVGAKLFVPAGVMREDGLATITRVRGNVYDFHIAATWSGRVAVTLPGRAARGGIMHRVGGMWVREFPRPGTRTVWVTTLSKFAPWDAVKKWASRCWSGVIRGSAKQRAIAVLKCVTSDGVQLTVEVVESILEVFTTDRCEQREILAAAGANFATIRGPIPIPEPVRRANCPGQAPAPQPEPADSGPTPPVTTNPGGSQTETHNPQPTGQNTPAPNPQPKPQPPAAPRHVIVVDNRATNGMGMREDTTPARLTTQPWTHCTSRGCNIYGTERSSGQTYDAAVCQTFGERTTNGHDTNSSDDANPERFESTRYYGVRLGDGTFGYVSEVWIRADYRGGLGLPGC